MRLRNVKNKEQIIASSLSYVPVDKKYRGCWKEIFGNSHPIHIEIGMGKGKFLVAMAKKYPDFNFIGIEKYDSVLARALEKVIEPLPNLRMIRLNAIEIQDYFDQEVECIYLNFSDPWPKKRHQERRLTSPSFLKRYDSIFEKEPKIVMKTDNRDLFEYSLVQLSEYGYVFHTVSFHLHQIAEKDLITTEYEDRFVKLNQPIYYFEASKRVV